MAVEDYTTYDIEQDADNHINLVGTNHIDSTITAGEDAWLAKDFGVGYFGNFEHYVDMKWIDSSAVTTFTGAWTVANMIDEILGLRADKYISVYFFLTSGSVKQLAIQADNGIGIIADNYTCIYNKWYYLIIKRNDTTITVKIYDEAARTTLLDTLTIAHFPQTFRYMYACISFNQAHVAQIDCDIENLDLREVVPSIPMGFNFKMGIRGGLGRPSLGTGGCSIGG